MVAMPDFGFDGVSSSLVEFMSFFRHYFVQLFFCIMYVTQTQQTTQTAHEQCRMRATTSWLQRIHACRPPPASRAGSNTTCGSLSALYYCCGFLFNSWLLLLSDPAINRPAGLCCCDTCMLPGTTTQIFHNVVI